MNERYFYLAHINGELINLLYSPKYKLEKITIASNDFISDIETFGEISQLLDDTFIQDNYDIKYNFNKKYFPNNTQIPKKLENAFTVWQEYSPNEVINTIAHILVLKPGEDLEQITEEDEEDEEDVTAPFAIKDGIEIKIYVISPKEKILHTSKKIETLIH